MEKRGDFRGVMAVIILFVILFSVLAAMYIRDVKLSGGNVGAYPEEHGKLIDQSKEMFFRILDNFRNIFNIKGKNISDSLKNEFLDQFNFSSDLNPGDCEINDVFICNDFQMDYSNDRIWFNIQSRSLKDIVIVSFETVSGIICDADNEKHIIKYGEKASFILENCRIVGGVSTVRISYFHSLLGKGVKRTVIVAYNPAVDDNAVN